MKIIKKLSVVASVLFVIGTSSIASAQLEQRCTDDPLGTVDAQGRNAWAANCGYMNPAAVPLYNAEGLYIVFTTGCGHGGCSPYVPVSGAAACVGGLVRLGYCLAGCYTPEQRLLFNRAYAGVQSAYETGLSSVTALTEGSTLRAMSFGEQPIRAFVAGETSETIFVLKDAKGDTLEVTSEHPMVRADGTIVKAQTLKVGDLLAKADGKTAPLVDVTTFAYKGTVWNVQPTSHIKAENILVAQGFLTGSVRFQNEWADDTFRLSLRDELDISNL